MSLSTSTSRHANRGARRCVTETLESRLLYAAGDLDTSFSGDGKLVFPGLDPARAIAVQKDGKILITGGFEAAGYVARLNANGTFDTTFGADDFADGIRFLDTTADIALQADGKIVLAGTSNILRLNSNGSLDANFNPSSFPQLTNVTHVALAPGGKIVVAAQNTANRDAFVYRFESDGDFDPTWDFDGEAQVPGFNLEQLRELVVQPDGKPLISGIIGDGSGTNGDFGVIRFQANGQQTDQSFGNVGNPTFGLATADFGGRDIADAMVLQPDGRIILGGNSGTSAAMPQQRFALARFISSGRLDTTFSGDGKLTTHPIEGGTAGQVRGLRVQQNGKIVAAGGVDAKFAVARYLSNGSLDTSFSGNGTVVTDLGGSPTGSSEFPEDVAIDFAGRIVLAGVAFDNNDTSLALARYVGDPTGSLAGNVFSDTNGNGAKNTGEGNLSGVRVYVDADRDGVFDSTERNALSDASGNYRIGGLAGGTYRVRAVVPAGRRISAPPAGFFDVTLATAQAATGRNFALVPPDPDDTIAEVNARPQNTLPVGSSGNFTMGEPRDVDLFRFTVSAGQRVGFDVDRAAGATLNTFLRTFNASGTPLQSNDNGAAPGEPANNADSYLARTFTTAGTYYVGVSAVPNQGYSPTTGGGDVSGGSTGGYRLTLTNLPAAQLNAPPPLLIFLSPEYREEGDKRDSGV